MNETQKIEATDKPQGKTRADFLAAFPMIEDWIVGMERLYGSFQRCGSINLSNGRIVFVTRFEKVFHINFHNPENNELEQDRHINLSPESFFALAGLGYLVTGADEWNSQWNALTDMVITNNPTSEEERNSA